MTLSDQGSNTVKVRSRSSNGWVSPWHDWWTFLDTAPTVTSDTYPEYGTGGGVGVTGTFTVRSSVPGVTSFGYSFDWGDTMVVPADDGTATISWTPDTSGFHALLVYAITSDGTHLSLYWYYFTVA